ncbi:GNAT family N-acetyltransferase [Chungangia koreensis]|uniref:GNAT family N-acetyltransferase n=1 Tax=Chungangia koreensis TaxID=752657 RepID=A0ABV8X8B8_9LACT
MTITIRLVSEEDHSRLEDYDLTEEQLRFTATPIDSIEKAKIEPNRYPMVILHNEEIAGFFTLHTVEGPKPYTGNPQAVLLRSYSIRNSFQGQGIAQKSMQLLPAFVREHFPQLNEILLAVNYQNRAAQHIYQKVGFEDTGKRVMGRRGEQYVYSLLL